MATKNETIDSDEENNPEFYIDTNPVKLTQEDLSKIIISEDFFFYQEVKAFLSTLGKEFSVLLPVGVSGIIESLVLAVFTELETEYASYAKETEDTAAVIATQERELVTGSDVTGILTLLPHFKKLLDRIGFAIITALSPALRRASLLSTGLINALYTEMIRYEGRLDLKFDMDSSARYVIIEKLISPFLGYVAAVAQDKERISLKIFSKAFHNLDTEDIEPLVLTLNRQMITNYAIFNDDNPIGVYDRQFY
jgi:hypothetical protein